MSDTDGMNYALSEARLALSEGEIPVGCAIVKAGKVIASARNHCEALGLITSHAEMNALSAVNKYDLRGATLYVTLEPCPMCAGAIAPSGIARVVFGAYDAQYGCCGSIYRLTEDPAFPNFCPADGGVLREECEAVLKTGFERIRKA